MSMPLTPGRIYDVAVERSGEAEDLLRDLVYSETLEPFYIFYQQDHDPGRVAVSSEGVTEDAGLRIFINRTWIRVIREQPAEREPSVERQRAEEGPRTPDSSNGAAA